MKQLAPDGIGEGTWSALRGLKASTGLTGHTLLQRAQDTGIISQHKRMKLRQLLIFSGYGEDES